ncbi:ankyrin repeat-containing domain protein [Aspergillus aurantiobrunneus]
MAHPEAMKLLLQSGTKVDALRPDRLTAFAALRDVMPIHPEGLERHYQVAKILLDAGASVTNNPHRTRELIRIVTQNGHPRYSKLLLTSWQMQPPNALPPSERAPAVAATGDAAWLEKVLSVKGLEYKFQLYQVTPLMAAVSSQNEDASQVAFRHEILYDARNSLDRTALHEALINGSEKTIRIILSKSTSIEQPEFMGTIPLASAVIYRPHQLSHSY